MHNSASYIRLVLDDDKIHCEATQSMWDCVKRVKHTVSNRFGSNLHTLASSVTGIIYQVTTEKQNDNIFDCTVRILVNSFKRPNENIPDLRNIVIGLDRGYSGYKKLVSYIKSHYGNTFGTLKRSMFAPFTYDQKKRGDYETY